MLVAYARPGAGLRRPPSESKERGRRRVDRDGAWRHLYAIAATRTKIGAVPIETRTGLEPQAKPRTK